MTNDLENFSKDQISAYDAVTETLKFAGVDLTQSFYPQSYQKFFRSGRYWQSRNRKDLIDFKAFHLWNYWA